MSEERQQEREEKQRGNGVRLDMLVLGLALIAVGAILLFTTLNPKMDFSDLFITWWPVLIILAGLTKILQSMMGQSQHGVLGSFVFIFIILALASGAAWRVVNIGDWEHGWWNELVLTESEEIAIETTDKLLIDTNMVDVRISASKNSEVVELTGKVWSRRNYDEDTDDVALDDFVSVDRSEGLVRINCRVLDRWQDKVRVDLELTVPASIALEVKGYRADASLFSLAGPTTVSVERGDAYIRYSKGLVQAAVERGDLTVRDAEGPVELGGDNVDIEIYNVYAPVTVNSERAKIELDNSYPLDNDISITNGTGSVELELARDSSFNFEGRTESGSVYIDYEDEDLKSPREYSFISGEGTHLIRIIVERGNISLED